MSRVSLLPIAISVVLACPTSARAQAPETFVQGLVAVITASDGTYGDEGPALVAAIEEMAAGLGRWDSAVARAESGLSAAIGGAPPPVAARMRAALGTIYLERGRLEAALTQFDAAAALDPLFADVHVLKGMALELANRPADAAGAYRAAWQRSPSSVTSAYLFLRTAPEADESPDTVAAMDVLSSAVSRSVDDVGTANRFIVVGLLDDASVPAPTYSRAAYVRAFDLLRQSKFEEAIGRLREAAASDALVTDPTPRLEVVSHAIAAMRSENAAAAIPSLAGALAALPSPSSELHRVLGTAYWAAQQYADSVEQFRAAIRLNPRDERSRLAIADVLLASGDVVGARQALLGTLQAIPDSTQAHWKLGRLYQSVGDEQGALRSFEAAAERPPIAGAGHLLASIGRLHHNKLDLESASAVYTRRVRVTPNDSVAHIDLGDVLRAQDRLRDALREFFVAALIDPTSARAFAAIGQLQVSEGRDDEGVRMLRKAVALDPAHMEAHYALSRALLRLGRREEAEQELLVFRQLQSKAMDDERRRFKDNQLKIEEALKAGDRKEPAR